MSRKTAPRKPKQESGGRRMLIAGRKPVLLGLEPAQHARISAAAKESGLHMTQFFVIHGLAAAETILRKVAKSR